MYYKKGSTRNYRQTAKKAGADREGQPLLFLLFFTFQRVPAPPILGFYSSIIRLISFNSSIVTPADNKYASTFFA